MKLILASEGFFTEEIVKKCEELVGKPRADISVAVINEAYAVKENTLGWVLINLNDVQKNFSAQSDLVNLLALDLKTVEERLRKHDVIFVVGGHIDYLMSVFTKTGFDKILPKLLETKVYVGSSAGSMVMGHKLDPKAYEKMYDQREEYGVKNYLEIVNLAIVPHLDSVKRPERRQLLEEAAPDHLSCEIYGLTDEAAVVVEDEKIYTIGPEPAVYKRESK